MLQISLLSIIGIITATIIKKELPEFSMVVVVCLGIYILIGILQNIEIMMEQMDNLTVHIRGEAKYMGALFKIVGVTYVCECASNICRDQGYSSMGSNVELFGKIMIFLSGLPILNYLLEVFEGIWIW